MVSLYKWAVSKRRARTCANNTGKAKVHRQLESRKVLKTMNGFLFVWWSQTHCLVLLVSVLTPSCLLPQPMCFVYVSGEE